MQESEIQSHSAGWFFYVKASFAIAIVAMLAGILFMPGGLLGPVNTKLIATVAA